jgi:hypothetical protein
MHRGVILQLPRAVKIGRAQEKYLSHGATKKQLYKGKSAASNCHPFASYSLIGINLPAMKSIPCSLLLVAAMLTSTHPLLAVDSKFTLHLSPRVTYNFNAGGIDTTNSLYLNTEDGINRVAVRSTPTPGAIKVTATRVGLKPATAPSPSAPSPSPTAFRRTSG